MLMIISLLSEALLPDQLLFTCSFDAGLDVQVVKQNGHYKVNLHSSMRHLSDLNARRAPAYEYPSSICP